MVHYRRPWIKGLLAAGYVVGTVAPADDYVAELETLTGQSHQKLTRLAPRSRNGFNDLACLNELSRIYRNLKPDLIVHFTIKPNIYGGMAAQKAGIPYVAVMTGLGYTFLHGGWRNQTLVPWLYKRGLAGVSEAIFYNDSDRTLFRERGIIPSYKGARIDGSGVNLAHFSKHPLPETGPDGVHFLFLGRILRDKGLIELFQAAKLLRQEGLTFRLTIAGSLQAMNPEVIQEQEFMANVEAVNSVVSEADEASATVHYLPTVADVRPLLAKSHVFVLPSYREGLSIAGAEALATGRPLIVTDVPGCRELLAPLPSANGYLVEARSVSSLADAMRKMMDSNNFELRRMGERSYQMALERFSADITTQQFLKIICTALDANS